MEFFKGKYYKNRPAGVELGTKAVQSIRVSPNKMILCKALCGESCLQSKEIKLTNWPFKKDGSGQLYDSMVNRMVDPSLFFIHDDSRIYPMYVVHHRSIECDITDKIYFSLFIGMGFIEVFIFV